MRAQYRKSIRSVRSHVSKNDRQTTPYVAPYVQGEGTTATAQQGAHQGRVQGGRGAPQRRTCAGVWRRTCTPAGPTSNAGRPGGHTHPHNHDLKHCDRRGAHAKYKHTERQYILSRQIRRLLRGRTKFVSPIMLWKWRMCNWNCRTAESISCCGGANTQ